jgi:HEAT repeat protein
MPGSFGEQLRRFVRKSEDFGRQQIVRWTNWRTATTAESEEGCLDALRAESATQRWRAAATLGRHPLRSPEVVAALIEALTDSEEFVRWQAAAALAQQEAGRVYPALAAALRSHNPVLRAGASQALGLLHDEAATQALLSALDDREPRVRASVASALGEIGDPTAIPRLIPLLQDRAPDVVRATARALSRIGTGAASTAAANSAIASASRALADSLTQPDQPLLVRRALAAALAGVPHPDTQPQLLAALDDPDPQVRGYAVQALGQVGGEDTHAALRARQADRGRLIKGTVGDQAGRALAMLERRGRRAPVPGKPEGEA